MTAMMLTMVLVLTGCILVYTIMILYFSKLHDHRSIPEFIKPGHLPFVSVIIAARNEEYNIINCLKTIVAQDYPADRFEILVSDDHSEDGTVTVAGEFVSSHPGISIRMISAGNNVLAGEGKKAAIVRAMHEARGEWILTTDADTVRGPGWIKSLMQLSQNPEARMVAGPVFPEPGSGLFPRIQSVEFMGIMGLTIGSLNRGFPLMANGANLLFKREDFFHAGGYRDNLKYASGDDQFLLASYKRNFGGTAIRFAYDEQAVVKTYTERSLRGFMNQRIRWASKSRGYKDPVVLVAGMVTLLAPFSIWISVVLAFVNPTLFWFPVVLFLIKALADFPLVSRMCRFFKRTDLLRTYVPAQLFQLIYIPVTGLVAWVIPYSWKGRRRRA